MGFKWADSLASNTANSAGGIAVDTTGTSATNPNYGDIYAAGTMVTANSEFTLFVEEITSAGAQETNYQATGTGTSVANGIAIVPSAASHSGYVDVGGASRAPWASTRLRACPA